MKTFVVQRRSDGVTVHAYSSEEPVEWEEYPFNTYNHIPQPEEEPVPENRILSRLAFRSRFNQVEKVTIELASLDNPSADMNQRQMSAALRSYLADVAAAEFIDLDRPDLVAGVQAMEQMGLIAAGRAAEILA